MDLGHWIFPTSFDIKSAFGFVYQITNTKTGKAYIGKKQFWSITRKSIKGKKRKLRHTEESDWRTYCSSSKDLQADILVNPKDIFVYNILKICKTKQELDYTEAKLQWELKVLSATLPDGTKAYYNKRTETLRFNKFTSDKVLFIS